MGDRLGRRIADALREAPRPDPPASDVTAARGALVGELRRRRARRHRAAAVLSVAVVTGLGSWAAVGRSTSSPASTSRPASAASGAAAGEPRARPSCAVVVGSGRCVGAVAAVSAADQLPFTGSGSGYGSAASAPSNGMRAPVRSGTPLRLRAGRSATLVLPAVANGASWSAPQIVGATAAEGSGAVVRVSVVGASGGSRLATATVTATVTGARPGTAELVATATCGPGSGRCTALEWSVEVEVTP